jgi:hypothetical protein
LADAQWLAPRWQPFTTVVAVHSAIAFSTLGPHFVPDTGVEGDYAGREGSPFSEPNVTRTAVVASLR